MTTRIRISNPVPQPIVSLNNVTLTLTSRAGPVNILRGLTLDVPEGQSLAIVGPSGSGKTSLLMILGGLEQATSGRVEVDGRSLFGQSQDTLARL
ncbi:MAG: ATP-binding cassette domain-containing protein, partial [Hyphomicrobium sp.]